MSGPLKIAITATPSPAPGAPLLLRGDIAAAFRQAAELGCQGVEIHLRRAEDVDVTTVKRLAAEYGLGVPTLGTGMAAAIDGLTFSDPDAEVRARSVERVRGHIELAAELGSAVTIGSLSGKVGSSGARRSQALGCLDEVCRTAGPLGVTVLLEPLNRYECDYINTLADGAGVLAEIGAPNLKLLADTFHMNIEEVDLAASLMAAGSRLGHVHLADTNRQAPGHGHLNVAGVLQALAAIGYHGYLSFEVLPLPDPCRAIRDGIEAIRAAVRKEPRA
ncbi:MAG: sugar phosphate isomerase/epimerase family protein [Acidobacteriota bacterium]